MTQRINLTIKDVREGSVQVDGVDLTLVPEQLAIGVALMLGHRVGARDHATLAKDAQGLDDSWTLEQNGVEDGDELELVIVGGVV